MKPAEEAHFNFMDGTGKRVTVFIDNSNIYKCLAELNKIDRGWVKMYDPQKLSEAIAGEREITQIFFYCSPPPSYMLMEGTNSSKNYWSQIAYYEAIKKQPKTVVKYGRLTGPRDGLNEKNLDTQLVTDMTTQAAQNLYDTAILVSNDGDYESAVDSVKSFKKKVEFVYFKGYVSMILKSKCDVARRARQNFFQKMTI